MKNKLNTDNLFNYVLVGSETYNKNVHSSASIKRFSLVKHPYVHFNSNDKHLHGVFMVQSISHRFSVINDREHKM